MRLTKSTKPVRPKWLRAAANRSSCTRRDAVSWVAKHCAICPGFAQMGSRPAGRGLRDDVLGDAGLPRHGGVRVEFVVRIPCTSLRSCGLGHGMRGARMADTVGAERPEG